MLKQRKPANVYEKPRVKCKIEGITFAGQFCATWRAYANTKKEPATFET